MVDDSILYFDGRLDFAHRWLLTAALRTTDIDHAGAERLVDLSARIIWQAVATITPDQTSTTSSDRALAAAARDVLNDGHPARPV